MKPFDFETLCAVLDDNVPVSAAMSAPLFTIGAARPQAASAWRRTNRDHAKT